MSIREGLNVFAFLTAPALGVPVGPVLPASAFGLHKDFFAVSGAPWNAGDKYIIEGSVEDPATPVPSQFAPLLVFFSNQQGVSHFGGILSFIRIRRVGGNQVPIFGMVTTQVC